MNVKRYLTPCPCCQTVMRCVPSLAFQVSGENSHRYTCDNCNRQLHGVIRSGAMVLSPIIEDQPARGVSPVYDPGEAMAARIMDGLGE